MPSRRSSRPALVLVFVVFAIALPLVGYYLAVELPERARYFTQSKFRALGVLAEQIESTLENRLNAVKAAAASGDADPARKIGLIRDLTYVPNPLAQCGAAPTSNWTSQPTPIPSRGSSGSRRRAVRSNRTSRPTPTATPTATSRTPTATPAAASGTPTPSAATLATLYIETLYIEPSAAPSSRNTSLLSIGNIEPSQEGATWKTDSTVNFCHTYLSSKPEERCPVCAKADLSRMLSAFIDASSLGETDLFIADSAGRVLFERGKADFRITGLPRSSARGQEQSQRESAAAATPAGNDIRKIDGLPFIEQLTAASSLHVIDHTNKSYKLFTQPIRLPVTSSAAPALAAAPAESTVWVLGALVPENVFESDVSRVSLGSLGYLPLALLLIVLVAPALKLGIMAPRDRLSRNDVRLLTVGALLATGIIAVIELDVYAYSWLKAALDAECESISGTLRAGFHKELEGAAAVLHQFVDKRARDGANKVRQIASERFGDSAAQCSPERREKFHGGDPSFFRCQVVNMFTSPRFNDSGASIQLSVTRSCDTLSSCTAATDGRDHLLAPSSGAPCRELCECSSWTDPFPNYYFFDLIFWADECGQQWEKWTALGETTPLTDMYDLTPFQNTIQQRLWEVEPGDHPERLSVDLLVSPNTGQRLAEVSIPIVEDGALIGVAGLVAQLVSFFQPVLPPGFEFAVVQDDGLVVFHSERQRSLYENFFEELSSANALRSLVGARYAGVLEADYHGRAQRLYVHPIKDAPWSLIVYYDKELLRTVDLDVLLTWFLLFLAYVLGAIIVWLLIRLVLPAADADWMWPEVQRRSACAAATIVLLLLAAAFVCEVVRGNSFWILMMVATGPAASVAYVYLQLASGQGRTKGNGRRYRLWLAGAAGIAGAAFVFSRLVALALHSATSWEAVLFLVLGVLLVTVAIGLLWPDRLEPTLVKADWLLPRWFWEMSLGLMLLFVVAVLPAGAFYRDAFEQGVEVFIRYGQLKLAEGLVARNHEVTREYHNVWTATDLKGRLQNTGDLPAVGLFWDGNLQLADVTPPPASTHSSIVADSVRPTPPACAPPIAPDMGIVAALRRIIGRHFSSLFMAYLPVYHAESMQLRNVMDVRADDDRWTWAQDACGLGVLSYAGPSGRGYTDRTGQQLPTVLKSRWPVPRLPIPTALLEWICAGAVLLLSLIVGFVTLRWLADLIFGLRWFSGADDDGLSRPEDGEASIRGALLINPTHEVADRVLQGVRPIDMHVAKGSLDILGEAALEGPDAWIVLHHLDHRLDDPALNRAKLALLERLVLGGRKPVFVISRVDPLIYFRERLRSPGDTKADENYVTPDEIDRWARVLERLVKIDFERWRFDAERVAAYLDGLKGSATVQPFWAQVAAVAALQQLWEECRWTASLRAIACAAASLRATPVADDSLVEYVRDLARPYYRSLWWLLTDEECLVLIHLANEGFVNPRNWRMVRRLEAKGLVRRTPALRLMNDSFRQFVLAEENPQQVRDWEGAAGPSPWATVRNVMLAVLMVVGVFVALFQPAALNLLVGSLTALVGALGALTTLFGFFQRGRTTPPSPPAP